MPTTDVLLCGVHEEIEAILPLLDANALSLYGAIFVDGEAPAIDGVKVLGQLDEGPKSYDAVCALDLRGNGVVPWVMELLDSEPSLAGTSVLFISPFVTATAIASELRTPRPVAVSSLVPGATRPEVHVEYSTALQLAEADLGGLSELVGRLLGSNATRVEDRVAHLGLRILVMIINEAVFALQEDVASAVDIDAAMKFGTNYPEGPLAWCDRIGADIVVQILDLLQSEFGEERYRPAILLRQYARAGLTFHTSQVE